MHSSDKPDWDGEERRQQTRCRRSGTDRRVSGERRADRRQSGPIRKRSLIAWIRTFTNPRLGVDRRKGGDQRSDQSRRAGSLSSLLSKDELNDLLK